MKRGEWARLLIERFKGDVNNEILTCVSAWTKREGTTARYNPLATTLWMPGSTVFNSVNVRNFPDVETGLAATFQTLLGQFPGYSDIRQGLLTGQAALVIAGLKRGSWCANPVTKQWTDGTYVGPLLQMIAQQGAALQNESLIAVPDDAPVAEPLPPSDLLYFRDNPYDKDEDHPIVIGGGFKARWQALGELALPTLGWPLGNETTVQLGGQPRTIQEFERGVLAWYPLGSVDGVPASSPWHVRCLARAEMRAVFRTE